MNHSKFQAYILAAIAFIEKFQNHTHQNTKNCYLAIASRKNALDVEKWIVHKLFIKNKIPVGKWVVLMNVVYNKDPKFSYPFGIDLTLDVLNYAEFLLNLMNKLLFQPCPSLLSIEQPKLIHQSNQV